MIAFVMCIFSILGATPLPVFDPTVLPGIKFVTNGTDTRKFLTCTRNIRTNCTNAPFHCRKFPKDEKHKCKNPDTDFGTTCGECAQIYLWGDFKYAVTTWCAEDGSVYYQNGYDDKLCQNV